MLECHLKTIVKIIFDLFHLFIFMLALPFVTANNGPSHSRGK